jgi:glucose-6-phosphate-specific signal transduction histidine kinase
LLAFGIATKAKKAGHDEISQIAQKIAETTYELYENVRSIVKKLRPEVLDTLGLLRI